MPDLHAIHMRIIGKPPNKKKKKNPGEKKKAMQTEFIRIYGLLGINEFSEAVSC